MSNLAVYQRFPNDPVYVSCLSGDGTAGNPFVLNTADGSTPATPYKFVSAGGAGQDSQVVKGAAGTLFSLFASNVNAAVRYVKFYDKASAPASTDTPVWTVMIPGSVTGAGVVINLSKGLSFTHGISFRMTTGVADNDAGAVAAGEVVLNLGYN